MFKDESGLGKGPINVVFSVLVLKQNCVAYIFVSAFGTKLRFDSFLGKPESLAVNYLSDSEIPKFQTLLAISGVEDILRIKSIACRSLMSGKSGKIVEIVVSSRIWKPSQVELQIFSQKFIIYEGTLKSKGLIFFNLFVLSDHLRGLLRFFLNHLFKHFLVHCIFLRSLVFS